MGKYNDFPPGVTRGRWAPGPPWAPFWQPTVVPKFRQPYQKK